MRRQGHYQFCSPSSWNCGGLSSKLPLISNFAMFLENAEVICFLLDMLWRSNCISSYLTGRELGVYHLEIRVASLCIAVDTRHEMKRNSGTPSKQDMTIATQMCNLSSGLPTNKWSYTSLIWKEDVVVIHSLVASSVLREVHDEGWRGCYLVLPLPDSSIFPFP